MNTFAMSHGAGQKLEFAFQRNDGTTSDLDWLSTGENLKSVILLARGEAELVVKTKPAPVIEPVTDPIVRVDRSIKLTYPDWVEKALHPELENVGPAEYDIAKLDQWLHDGQKNGQWTSGSDVYAKLKDEDNKLLKTCLNLRDLEEIQKKGIAFFRKHFKGKAVSGWSSVVQDRDGVLGVPHLYQDGGKVLLDWNWLYFGLDSLSPAFRHAS